MVLLWKVRCLARLPKYPTKVQKQLKDAGEMLLRRVRSEVIPEVLEDIRQNHGILSRTYVLPTIVRTGDDEVYFTRVEIMQ